MPTEPSAEDRFVEAMRLLWAAEEYKSATEEGYYAAVEAFADAVCETHIYHGDDSPPCNPIGYAWEEHLAIHARDCRTRLLARVMEEADGR